MEIVSAFRLTSIIVFFQIWAHTWGVRIKLNVVSVIYARLKDPLIQWSLCSNDPRKSKFHKNDLWNWLWLICSLKQRFHFAPEWKKHDLQMVPINQSFGDRAKSFVTVLDFTHQNGTNVHFHPIQPNGWTFVFWSPVHDRSSVIRLKKIHRWNHNCYWQNSGPLRQ